MNFSCVGQYSVGSWQEGETLPVRKETSNPVRILLLHEDRQLDIMMGKAAVWGKTVLQSPRLVIDSKTKAETTSSLNRL